MNYDRTSIQCKYISVLKIDSVQIAVCQPIRKNNKDKKFACAQLKFNECDSINKREHLFKHLNPDNELDSIQKLCSFADFFL